MTAPLNPPETSQISSRESSGRLVRMIAALGKIRDTSLALDTTIHMGLELFGASAGAAFLLDDRNQLQRTHLEGIPTSAEVEALDALAHLLLSMSAEQGAGLPRAAFPVGFPWVLAIPLFHRGELQGGVGFFFVEDGPGPEEGDQARILAGLLPLVLENIRLSEGALQQSTELGAFYESAASLGEDDELPVLLAVVLERACTLLNCRGGAVYLTGPGSADFPLVASLGLEPGQEPTRLEEGSLGARVALSHGALRQELTAEAGSLSVEPYRSHPWIRRALAVPLTWRRDLIGVMELYGDPDRRPFQEADLRRATLIAQQAANATAIARLIESERRQRGVSEALQSASLVLGRDLELELVLDRILEEVMRAIPCDAANFQDYVGAKSQVIRCRGYEKFGLGPAQVLTLQLTTSVHGNLRRMIAGETVVVGDTARDPDWVPRPGFAWLRSWAGAPIRFGDETLGFVNLDSATPYAFDSETARGLVAFAAHAGSAMHHAQVFRMRSQEHRRLETVHEIGRQLSGTLAPLEIIQRLQEALAATQNLTFALTLRAPRRPGGRLERVAWWPSDQPVPAEGGSPAVLRAVEKALSQAAVARAEALSSEPTAQTWAVPLQAGGESWGVLLLGAASRSERDSTEFESLLAAIGQQAGLALAVAERHGQVERRLTELTLLQKVVSSIASQLEVDAVLGEVTEQLHANLGYPVVHIYRRSGEALDLSHHSGPAPVVEHLALNRGIVGRVARTGHAAFVRDVRRDPDYVAGLIGTVAEIAVPIRQGEDVVGVLNVETSDPDQLDSSALELLELLADQVSVALQNASLYEDVRQNVGKLEERVSERTGLLEKVLEQARAAERVKSQFVADVSHELRTPLTNIGLYLDLVEIGSEDRRAEYMGTLRREVERLGSLIEQLLAISHLDTEKVDLRRHPTNLNGLVEMLVEDRSRHAALKGLTVRTEMPEDAPTADIDPVYVLQAMTNMVSNAIHYTPPGGVITLSTGRQSWQGRPWAVFSVTDSGPGVPEEEKKRIFDRFYRGLVGRTSGVSGTGLGLAISKEIVDLHGGRITLTSQAGRGASFTLWLPEPTQ